MIISQKHYSRMKEARGVKVIFFSDALYIKRRMSDTFEITPMDRASQRDRMQISCSPGSLGMIWRQTETLVDPITEKQVTNLNAYRGLEGSRRK